MKEQEIVTAIEVPEGYEFDHYDSETNQIVWKSKKITYHDVCKKLFDDKKCEYCYLQDGYIKQNGANPFCIEKLDNALTVKQLHRMLLYNQLMNIAVYLNKDWKPDWTNELQPKYVIGYDNYTRKYFTSNCYVCSSTEVYFASKELAEQAIEIMEQEDLSTLFKY